MAHLVAAAATIGASTHHAVFSWRKDAPRARRMARLALALGLVAVLLGACIYPTYKVEVRLAWLEPAHPRVARLFDLKEHFVALALAALAASVLVAGHDAPAFARRVFACAGAVTLWAAGLIAAWVVAFAGHRG